MKSEQSVRNMITELSKQRDWARSHGMTMLASDSSAQIDTLRWVLCDDPPASPEAKRCEEIGGTVNG